MTNGEGLDRAWDRVAESLIRLIRERLLGEIYAHARRAYPEECCGMILGSGVRRCENIQDELHRLDPVAHPRTARTGFSFTAEDSIFLIASLETDDPVLAVYHSHPDGSAQFSHADAAGAARYPDQFHLVIACGEDGVKEAVLYSGENGSLHVQARFGGRLDRASVADEPFAQGDGEE